MSSKLKVLKVRVDDETYYKFIHLCMILGHSASKEISLLVKMQIAEIEQKYNIKL